MHRCLGIAFLFFFPFTLFSQDLLFEERFSGGQLQNEWRRGFNGNAMEVESFLNNPSGDGWVGKLGNHFSGGNVGATHSAEQFTDFFLEAKVYVPVTEGVYYGIEFRVDTVGLSAGYQFIARFTPGGMITPRLRFRARPTSNPGMPTVIRDWEAAEIPGGIPTASGWHTFAVKAEGHRFWFYFDGEMLPGSPILDYNFLSGAIGAYVWDTSSPLLNLYIDDIVVYSDIPTGVSDNMPLPAAPRLLPNYPNPVRDASTFSFDLPVQAQATVDLCDLLGRRLLRIAEGEYDAGLHHATLDASRLAEGSYLIRLDAGGETRVRVFTVVR